MSEEGKKKKCRNYVFFTADLIPRDIDFNELFKKPIVEKEIGEEKGRLRLACDIDTSLGPEEIDDPSNLAPRVADFILHHREGLDVEDYEIEAAHCEDIPPDTELPEKDKKECRLLVIDLEAKLVTANAQASEANHSNF